MTEQVAPTRMTVADLIRELQRVPQDLPVAISIDAEGNQFKYIDEVVLQAWENQAGIALKKVFLGEEYDEDAAADTAVIYPV